MSDFISLYTAFSGLQAAQAGMDTASHNVANAGTEGYTRQRVGLASRLPHTQPFGQVGAGVDIVEIGRMRDTVLDNRVRAALDGSSRLQTLGNLLSGLEASMGEPDHGITAALGGLWASFEELALDPPDTAARVGVLGTLDTLTRQIRSVADAWDRAGADAATDLATRVDETNRLVEQVGRLNVAILSASSGPTIPNDLLDQRDALLDDLSRIAGVTATTTDRGTARVSLGGLSLVHDGAVSTLSLDASTNTIVHSSGGIVRPGGELAGLQSFLTVELPAHQANLDAFVEDLAAALNTQHAAGYTIAGVAGGDLVTYTPGAAARSLAVAVTDPGDLAVAGNPGPPVAAFDGANVEALAGLRTTLAATGATVTLDASISSLVADLGATTAATLTSADAQAGQASAAEAARTQVHGVSVDEEMVSLMTYQRAYEAAARVMTAVDQALDTLINRTGIVGR